MKKTTCVITYILLILVTNAQTNTIIMEYFKNIPEISAEHEVLNRNSFPGVISRNGVDSIKEKKAAHTWKGDEYKEYDSTGMLLKQYDGFSYNGVEGREFINPYIYIYRKFYPNDGLKMKKISCVFGFNIGKEYHYDEKGNLTETIDHNKGYDFTVEDVIRYCITNGIDLKSKTYDGRPFVSIMKTKDENNKLIWRIEYPLPPARGVNITYVLIYIDAYTGQVIMKKKEVREIIY